MKLIINEQTYEYPQWNINNGKGELRLNTEDDFATLTEKFNVPAGDRIVQTDDNDNETGIWFVNSLESIQVSNENENRVATITYGISILPEDVKASIDSDIEDSTDAMVELAMMLDETKQAIKNSEEQFKERDERLKNQDDQIAHFRETLEGLESRLDVFADRIANLENKIGG